MSRACVVMCYRPPPLILLQLRGFGAAFRYVILLLRVYTPCSFGEKGTAAAPLRQCRVIVESFSFLCVCCRLARTDDTHFDAVCLAAADVGSSAACSRMADSSPVRGHPGLRRACFRQVRRHPRAWQHSCNISFECQRKRAICSDDMYIPPAVQRRTDVRAAPQRRTVARF